MKKSFMTMFVCMLIAGSAALQAQHDIDIETTDDGHKKIVRIKKGGGDIFSSDPLNLTPEQKKEFKKLDLQFEKDTISLRNELELKNLEKEVELEADTPDLQKLNKLIDTIHNLQASIEKKRMAIELKKRSLLTEEQRKDWRPIMGHREKKIIMLKSGGEHDMMWFHGDDLDMPMNKDIEQRIEIR